MKIKSKCIPCEVNNPLSIGFELDYEHNFFSSDEDHGCCTPCNKEPDALDFSFHRDWNHAYCPAVKPFSFEWMYKPLKENHCKMMKEECVLSESNHDTLSKSRCEASSASDDISSVNNDRTSHDSSEKVDNFDNMDLNLFLEKHIFWEVEDPVEALPSVEFEYWSSKKKMRKTPAQTQALKKAYLQNDTWSDEYILQMADHTSLTRMQVYKWYASERKKNGKGIPKSKVVKAKRL